jgi:hypothetical protein
MFLMTWKLTSKSIQKLVVSALAVTSMTVLSQPTLAAATTKKPKSKRITTKRSAARPGPKETTPTTTLGKNADQLRRQQVREGYDRYKAATVAFYNDPKIAPTVLPPVEVGRELESDLEYAQDLIQRDRRLEMTLAQYEDFDFRFESVSESRAVVRVCERLTNVARKISDNSPLPDPLPTSVTDAQFKFVYIPQAKRWLVEFIGRLNDEDGKSNCADGK